IHTLHLDERNEIDLASPYRRRGGESQGKMPVSQREEGEADRTSLDGFEMEIFNLVRKEATSEQWKEWLRAPLEHAMAKGDINLFTRLMDAGANGSTNWRGCRGQTLLGSAAGKSSEEMVLALLKAGAKRYLNVTFGARSESALHVAAAQGAEAVSATLMLAGADPDLRDGEGRCPLHVAAEAGHHGIVRELLLKGVCPEAKTWDRKHTPLHLAAQKGNTQCVSKLLLGGADKNSLTCRAETPLYLAAEGNQLGAVEELLAAGANLDLRARTPGALSPLEKAAQAGHEDVVRALLRCTGDINACDYRGYTALHWAAGAEEEPVDDTGGVVRMLLAAGADIEAKTSMGYTPLQVSCVVGQISSSSAIYALLEGGAEVNSTGFDGWTQLYRACNFSSLAGVELLLRWGADENLTDVVGDTAADILGLWEEDEDVGDIRSEQRKADDQRIRRILARAPADRSWRRRGWLVLCRDPTVTKVQLATKSCRGDRSTKVAKAGCDLRRVCDQPGYRTVDDMGDLVRRVVLLEQEDVFRVVVGFL
ncbi:unnamed protein product, partial [Pylaiella littoralis]